MPIKGLTTDVLPAFPRLGKLRKGAAKPERGYGKDLSYFRFSGEVPGVEETFVHIFGPEPAMLTVFLPFARLEDDFAAWMEEWSAGGLLHRCDGETMDLWRNGKTYSREPRPCPYASGERQRTTKEPGCKQVGRLTVIVPELVKAGHVGYVVLETHSKHDLINIQASLLAAADARSGNPLGLRNLPFVIRRVEREISTPTDDGSRARRKKWLVEIQPVADWVALQLEAARQMALAGPDAVPQIAARSGMIVDTGTGEVLDGAPAADDFDEDEEPVEAVATPAPEPPPVTTNPQGANGSGHGLGLPPRPWPADATRMALVTRANSPKLTPDDKSMTRGKMALLNLYRDDELARRAIRLFVFGHNDLTPAEAETLSRWVAAKPVKDAGGNEVWEPDPLAVQEARAIVEAQALEEGQKPLFQKDPIDPAY